MPWREPDLPKAEAHQKKPRVVTEKVMARGFCVSKK